LFCKRLLSTGIGPRVKRRDDASLAALPQCFQLLGDRSTYDHHGLGRMLFGKALPRCFERARQVVAAPHRRTEERIGESTGTKPTGAIGATDTGCR
jgi:hypothetical protein